MRAVWQPVARGARHQAVPGSPARAVDTDQDAVQLRVGTELLPFQLPRNPKVALAPAPSDPLKETFVAVTAEPLALIVAFHTWLIVWPLAKVQVTRQPLIAEEPAVTRTSPWKPPCHWPATL